MNIFVKVNEVDVAQPRFCSPVMYKLSEIVALVLVITSGFCHTAKLELLSEKSPIFTLGGV